MKRKSILVLIVCLATQQIAIARYRLPSEHRIRYSMHAFGHKSSGLVSGHVRYSPYAFGVNNRSGLVNAWTRYSPHAFGTKHNGLISEWGPRATTGRPENVCDLNQQKLTKAIDRLSHSIDRIHSNRQINQHGTYTTHSSRRYTTQTVNLADLTSDNPRLLMRAFLNTLIPGQFRVSNLLRVDQEVVSFNVVIENRNLIIKYWNPVIIRSINEASDQKTEQLSDYMKAWVAVENFYDKNGDRVVHIVSADQEKILMALTGCLQTETM